MNTLRAAIGLVVVSAELLAAKPSAKVSIPDLLNPQTRLKAFQEFWLRAHPGEIGSEKELDAFAEWHADLTLSKLQRGSEAPSYLLTWDIRLRGDGWDDEAPNRGGVAPSASRVLTPVDYLEYQIFSADGAPLPSEGDTDTVFNGIIADLNGDGEPELVERVLYSEGSSIPAISGLEPQDSASPAETIVELLKVRPPGVMSKATFAVVYNMHPKSQALGNTWGFEAVGPDKDGLYEIQLGPVRAPAGVEPKVVFRWDKGGGHWWSSRGKWVGPKPQAGDHYRVLSSKKCDEEAAKIARSGGLGYSLALSPFATPERASAPASLLDAAELPPEQLSKPYAPRSLSGLSHEALFAFMSERRTAWDYLRKRADEATAVPEFWTLDPKTAALSYIVRNRPPEIRDQFLLSALPAQEEAAPEEGDVTLSDGPSGCFSPSGAYEHHLHCAKDGSFLAYAEIVRNHYSSPPTEDSAHLDLRKLNVRYEDARQLLQTIWWMSRVRSRPLSGGHDMNYMSGGSTSDGFATVQIAAGKQKTVVSGMRSAGSIRAYMGTGARSSDYDPSAFINLVVRLFQKEAPARFGSAWTSLATPKRWTEGWRVLAPMRPEEAAWLKATALELIHACREGQVSFAAALPAAEAVGVLGWNDLRPEVESLSATLPPLTEHEKRLATIDAELKRWKETLGGEAASLRAHHERTMRREAARQKNASSPPAPGAPQPTGPAASPIGEKAPLTSEEEATFGEYDRLVDRRVQVIYRAPKPERDVAELREAARNALRKLDVWNDADALYQWGMEEPLMRRFALSRLAKLDRKRAAQLLSVCEQEEPNPYQKNEYASARRELETADVETSKPLSDGRREQLRAILADTQASYNSRQQALAQLVPADEPKCYADPEIDRAILDLIHRKAVASEIIPFGLPMAAARRLGGKAWNDLATYAESKSGGIPRLNEALPALTLIAQREPEIYRARLLDILRPELSETNGYLDFVLWSVWLLDLRELKSDVEKIATNGPEDYEGTLGGGGTNHRGPIRHRYHRARHITALWNEPDPATRTRLLIAFAAAECEAFSKSEPDAAARYREQLAAACRELSTEQRSTVEAFIKWCEAHAIPKAEETSEATAQLANVLRIARTVLEAAPAR